jgi:hypothetical protein
VIRSVNHWFARVVYQRDAWDVWLDDMAADAEDWRWMIVVSFAQVGVWFSRSILKLIMFFGHGVSSFLLRQMEYDADSYQIKLVGSQSFEETFRRLHVLDALLKPAYNEVRAGWNTDRVLPDNFPALLLKYDSALPPERRNQVENTMGLHATSLFDTHPSSGDRIRCARQVQEPGVFHLQEPACALFNNFEVLSKQLTQLHYSDDIGLPVEAAKLVSVHREAEESPVVANPLAQANPELSTPGRLRIKK